MKKLAKVLALVVVAAMLCLALASCGLSGTYKNNGLFGLGATELTFKGSKVTVEMGEIEAEGTYKIDGDKIEAVHMIPGWTHNIINLSDTENLVTLMWANELFDPNHPDTFFDPV